MTKSSRTILADPVKPIFLARCKVLPASFYGRDPRKVAKDILGMVLLRREGRKVIAGRIVEVEAYLGESDPAAHAFAGRTNRNFVLFGPPGKAYVYFIYGNHYCLNVSCETTGKAGSLLFRALEPLAGLARMAVLRGITIDPSRTTHLRALTAGPGRMAQALGITRDRDNDKDLTSSTSDLQIIDDESQSPKIVITRRIGITKASSEQLRYSIAGNPFVSGKKIP